MSEMPRKSAYLKRRLGEATKEKSDHVLRSIRDAYKDSLKLDVSNSDIPQPASIRIIEERYGFNIKQQKNLGIAINKTAAKEFLAGLGAPLDTTFKQKHNPATYVALFKREAVIIGQNEMLCTYAEWMHMENWPYEPTLE